MLDADTYAWMHILKILGFVLWVAGLVAAAGLLRVHEGADAASRPGIINGTRIMVGLMEAGSTIAIGVGLLLAFKSPRFPTNAFATGGWLHVKLLLVVLGLLVPHILIRIKIGKLRRDAKAPPLPGWVLPVVLAAAAAVIVLGAHPTLLRK
jgi:uncharacterized membrane protein